MIASDVVGNVSLETEAVHTVQFYETDDYLTDIVVTFLAEGLAAAGAVIVIATEAHRRQFTASLIARGVDLEGARSARRLVMLDAEETLARFMVDGAPDPARFRDVLDAVIAMVTHGDGGVPIRAYGEMVDVLWRGGSASAAVELEELWNDAQRERAFSLLCAYAMGSFYKEAGGLHRVCATHSHVREPQVARNGNGHGEHARALAAEIGQRVEVERALRAALRERKSLDEVRALSLRRTEQLVHITSAIAEAVTPEQVYAAIVDEVGAALHASSTGLFLVDKEARVARLVRSSGYTAEHLPRLAQTPLDVTPPMPATDCIRTGAALWIESQPELLAGYPHLGGMITPGRTYQIACLPLMGRGRAIGCIGLTFDDVPALDDAERDFLRLATRYAGQALERLRLLEAERHSRQRTELLYALAREVIVATSVDDVFDAALDAIAAGLGARRAAILTYGDDPVMKFRAWRGLSDGYRAAVEGHSPWGRDVQDAAPVIVADVLADPGLAAYRALFESERIGALAFIPLLSGQRLVGKFMVYYEAAHRLRDEELDLARAIADHVAAAVARFAALDELRDTVRFNEMFTGILGHDLRNPLGAIVTAAQLAILRSPGERITKPLSRILTSSTRMTRMIEQLLDFTRVRVGGGIPLLTQSIDLLPVVRQVMEELEDANPDWTLRLDSGGSAVGAVDADRLAQVFSNLVANAVQHGDVAGGVRVRVDGSAPDRLRIEIHNAGAIPEELLPTMFDPMSGSQRRRDGSRGLGLGLYVSREIVRAHRGTIHVTSTAEDGTTFTIELPR